VLLAAAFSSADFAVGATEQERSQMYGMIAKMTAVAERRNELIALLGAGTRNMPGCLSYIISRDLHEENTIWVTEAWDSKVSHDASFSIPAIQTLIVKTKPLVADFSKVTEIEPVLGI
jgi:quinol monooxygenase YgiN